MALSLSTLTQNIIGVFQDGLKIKTATAGSPPLIDRSVAKALADAYDSYIKSGAPKAGSLSISVPGNVSALEQALTPTMMAGWSPGLLSYWSPVMWAGPGFIPANPTIPVAMAGVTPEVIPVVSTPSTSMENVASRIAAILHKYTMQIKVTSTTTTVPPVVAVIPGIV